MANVETPLFPTFKQAGQQMIKFIHQLPEIGPEIMEVGDLVVDIKLARQHELMGRAHLALKRYEVGRLIGVLKSQIKE